MRLLDDAVAAGLLLAAVAPPPARAQSVALSGTSGLTFVTGSRARTAAARETGVPTGGDYYPTYGSQVTLGSGAGGSSSTTWASASASASVSSSSASSSSSSWSSSSSSSPSSSQPPQQPCNNHVELCTRRYSDVTHVGAHNSPFVRPGNAASNQALPVKAQLDDGVRLLQAQMHWPAGDGGGAAAEPHLCHTSCDLLDAGPVSGWLAQVREWLDGHGRDVVTVVLGNGNYSPPELYAPWIERAGVVDYAYAPPLLPMAAADWPTLGELLARGRRLVLFLDYRADQRRFPWLLDQFAHMWETPFDPLDRRFPCTVQRPPQLAGEAGAAVARERLYLMNHNLNVRFDVLGAELLVPAVALLNETNGVAGEGSLGRAAERCRAEWGRAPNFLNVDYYNYGSPAPGSVFEVAARLNNVSYDRPCCGRVSGAAGGPGQAAAAASAAAAAALASAAACCLLLL